MHMPRALKTIMTGAGAAPGIDVPMENVTCPDNMLQNAKRPLGNTSMALARRHCTTVRGDLVDPGCVTTD